MGKGKGQKKTEGKKQSSGQRKARRINKEIRRLKMKMARWDRYTEEVEAGTRKGTTKRWNTDGLRKHMEFLETLV